MGAGSGARAAFLIALLVPGGFAHAQAQPEGSPVAESSGPRLTIRGFSNVDYAVHDEGRPDTFALGQFDMFMTSALSDKVSVLAEVVFEFGEDNAAVLDVERVQIKYAPSDLFTISAGRMHTPLGFWNQTFHHGAWFQTTADRPQMYLFEDDGGILPVHEIGVEVAGRWSPRVATLKYNLSVVNGRGRIPDEVTNVQDLADGKAVNVLLGVAPESVRGLELGVNAYFDTIPPGGDLFPPVGEIKERILGAYLVYRNRGVEVLAEASRVRHRTPEVFDTWGAYAQGSVKRGRFTPYYRFDWVKVAEGDPFLSPKNLGLHTVGLRVDAGSWVALKAEYRLARPAGEPDVHAARLQAAFAF